MYAVANFRFQDAWVGEEPQWVMYGARISLDLTETAEFVWNLSGIKVNKSYLINSKVMSEASY